MQPHAMPSMEIATDMGIDARDAFGDLLERHRKIVFKVVNTYAYDPHDRADLAQEIAVQLWRAYPAYDPQRRFSTWMYRIALNVAISHVRTTARHRRHAHVPLDESVLGQGMHELADDGADHERWQQVRALQRFIRQLKPLERAVLLLYLEERTYSDIADILGITETNVATKINRLKQRIRNEI